MPSHGVQIDTGPRVQDIRKEYPQWLETHAQSLSHEDLTRYEKQHEYVCRICVHFEEHGDQSYDEMLLLLQQVLAVADIVSDMPLLHWYQILTELGLDILGHIVVLQQVRAAADIVSDNV